MDNIRKKVSGEVVIQLRDISKAYELYPSPISRLKEALHPFKKKYHETFFALKDIGFSVNRGEILGILGKNGSGKSTLLKIVSKVLLPTTGQVDVKGDIAALLELGSGFNPEFTGLENIYFYGSILGFSKKEMDERLDEILSFADIGNFIYQPLRIYSTGMKLRLAFAVSTNIDSEILILDEILAVGDELFQRKCYAKMEQFMKSGKTILFVSHSPASIVELCTRAILLDGGELILEGTPKLVISQYQKYLYSKPENASTIREEIKKMNHNLELKEAFECQVAVEDTKSGEAKEETARSKNGHRENETLIINEKQQSYFIPDFVPKTTVKCKNYDVDIYDIYIKTLSGEKANVLVVNDEYIYTYKVRSNIDARNVYLNMAIKTEKGMDIGWAAAPGENKFLERVRKGEEYLVEWHFRCNLLPGTYYTNAAIRSFNNGERIILNRIVDALVFKVQENIELNYGGLTHFDQYAKITKIK